MQRALATQRDLSNFYRLGVFAALMLTEVFACSFAFSFQTALPGWVNPITYAKVAVQAGIVASAVMVLGAWPARATVAQAWASAMAGYNWWVAVAANLLAFSLLLVASVAFSAVAAASAMPWGWFALYCAWLIVTAATLALVAAPPTFWRWLWSAMPMQIATALLSGVLLVLAGRLTLEGWETLAGWTLNSSHWLLTLYENSVVLDVEQHILGVGGFHVRVLKECSGYEGMGLVTAFLVFYCWLMRRELRFPHALLLIPIGIAASWMLNTIRIAMLISIGAHVSPEVALNGFHSQAGWIGFLALAVGLMVLSTRTDFFRRERGTRVRASQESETLLLAFIVPFMALMAASIIASVFAPHDQWLYPLKVAAIAGALWWFRDVYAGFARRVSPLSLAIGAGIGVAWIMTEPANAAAGGALREWITALPVWLALLWLACRGLGTVVLVPLAEELAFRGYLQRVLISRQFEQVSFAHLTWVSFVVTSVLFGLIHQRWLEAAIAGACYALVAYRTGRLWDAIAAHAASNAVIFAWAVAAQRWSLL